MASCVLQRGWSSNFLDLDTWRRWCMIDSIGWICRHGSNLNCVTAYRCLHGLAPSYLSRLCIPVSEFPGCSHLRSATSGKLLVPSCKTKTIGPRAFAVACPTAWNNLPIELSGPANSDSFPTFKKNLKTHLFTQMLTRYWPFIFIYSLTFLEGGLNATDKCSENALSESTLIP